MKINYQNLEKKIDFKFRNKDLLIQSLTHKSFNINENNEKIEFLGDRVLGLVIAKKLLEIYPKEKEGALDKKFASLVNKKTCLEIAKQMDLANYIRTFNPNNKRIKIEDKIISDSCEALIGAMYLDKGFSSVEKTILALWKNKIEKSVITEIDAKTKLQESTLKKFKSIFLKFGESFAFVNQESGNSSTQSFMYFPPKTPSESISEGDSSGLNSSWKFSPIPSCKEYL